LIAGCAFVIPAAMNATSVRPSETSLAKKRPFVFYSSLSLLTLSVTSFLTLEPLGSSLSTFSLATKADTRILRYEHRNVVVEIAPSVRGLATIHDKDILIYCISQLMAKKECRRAPGSDLALECT
jgi:hypothetical protein